MKRSSLVLHCLTIQCPSKRPNGILGSEENRLKSLASWSLYPSGRGKAIKQEDTKSYGDESDREKQIREREKGVLLRMDGSAEESESLPE